MWTSIDQLRQIKTLETVSKTIQKLSSEYLTWAKKRNEKKPKIVEKHLSTWCQIKDVSNSFAKHFLKVNKSNIGGCGRLGL